VIAEAVPVLQAVAARFGHEFTLSAAPFGGIAIDQHGEPLPAATLQTCLASDAILLGAIGGPKWSSPQAKVRPESGLLRLRANWACTRTCARSACIRNCATPPRSSRRSSTAWT
jgi:3-isopropylmalate dehydrogenase